MSLQMYWAEINCTSHIVIIKAACITVTVRWTNPIFSTDRALIRSDSRAR